MARETLHRATATIPGYTFMGEGIGKTPEEAREKALDAVDQKIDNAYKLSRGPRSYEKGKELKDSAEVTLHNK